MPASLLTFVQHISFLLSIQTTIAAAAAVAARTNAAKKRAQTNKQTKKNKQKSLKSLPLSRAQIKKFECCNAALWKPENRKRTMMTKKEREREKESEQGKLIKSEENQSAELMCPQKL